jgi:glycosyltransferase involved in cell wall biosynthesis
MRILYLSCHSVLEFDEIRLFRELGHYVFSPGAYVEPLNPGDAALRPGISDLGYDPDDLAHFHRLGNPGVDNKDRLTIEFVNRFDAVVIMHLPRWIELNWEAMKHKLVVWRTIGQSMPHQELALTRYRQAGLKVVRYSPRESVLENYIGSDATIRFYKDPDEFKDWNGNNKVVVNFTQSMAQRAAFCGLHAWEASTLGFHREIYGPNNESLSCSVGRVSYETLKEVLRDSRVYFYTGTHPASYTLNFIEAWMTGIPVVAIGPHYGNCEWYKRPIYGQKNLGLYEVSELIDHGVNGYVSDDFTENRKYIELLMTNDAVAKSISEHGRAKAIQLFGKPNIKQQWDNFWRSNV